jgi:hypothetical protein
MLKNYDMILVENRTHRRLDIAIHAGVSAVSGFLGRFCWKPKFQCVTSNVSIQGMKLLVTQPIEKGASVKLWVTLPEAKKSGTIRLLGRVCWVTPHSVPGQFVAGIRLGDRPARAVAIWAESIRERICAKFQNDRLLESIG